MDATIKLNESQSTGKHCHANTRYELQRALAKMEAARRHLERAFHASDAGLRPPLAVTSAEAKTVIHHVNLMLRAVAA